MDIVSRDVRSRMMSGIRGKHTKPETLLRRLLHRQGYRFRLHGRDLPGSPDVVLPKYRAVVFMHGCFWHRHAHCRYAYTPVSNRRFWLPKFESNVSRDARNLAVLHASGWRVAVVWECALKAE